MFSSMTVGTMPLSRNNRTTVRPVGPNPMTTARWRGSVVVRAAGTLQVGGNGRRPIQQRPEAWPIAQATLDRAGSLRYASGFSTIETIDVATSTLVASIVRMPSSRPIVARMNENSPICASAIATVNADLERIPHRPDEQQGDQRLADEHDRQRADHQTWRRRATRPGPAACRRTRRTAPRTRLAWAVPRMRPAGCSRTVPRPSRRETRQAPSTR